MFIDHVYSNLWKVLQEEAMGEFINFLHIQIMLFPFISDKALVPGQGSEEINVAKKY